MLFRLALMVFLLSLPFPVNSLAASDQAGQATELPGFSMDALRRLADGIERTGVGSDSIPAINRPVFVSVSNASLSMDDNEIVFIVEYPNGKIRIYPRRILVWHEVVNDIVPATMRGQSSFDQLPKAGDASADNFTISYSPLTGTVSAFRSQAGRYPTTFGVTGDLINANTVLYDRMSISLWSQLLGTCVEGPLRGKRLERIPVLWARWGGAKIRYAEKAEVLSTSTGFRRTYGRDPYGSYLSKGSYYDNNVIANQVSFLDKRLPPKTRILGLEMDDLFGAVVVDVVKAERILNFTMGVTPLVAMYDEELDAVRVFDRRLDLRDDRVLTFEILEDNFVDSDSKSVWDAEGRCIYGRNREKRLTPVFTVDSMWFAWAAFHRACMLYPGSDW